jgi:4-hydroxy-tetrahydrodipicolinate synthase
MSTAGAYRGVYPILYAFFDERGALAREAMRRQVEVCLGAGAHGLAILGIATEVGKLSEAERRQVLEWAAEDVAGRVPLAVTVYGNSVEQQRVFVRAAEEAGAQWVILQPPPVRGLPENEYVRFFGAVAESTSLTVGVQNAPEYLGDGRSNDGLNALRRHHGNFTVLKGEASAVGIRRVVEETAGELAVFNGRGGLELPDILRAGCAGMIPAPDTFDRQIRIFDLMARGSPEAEAEAEHLYAQALPATVFIMQSIETMLCYGKRIAAWRMGLGEVHDRAPALTPTDFGLACARRYAEALGPITTG